MSTETFYTVIASPIGELPLTSDGVALTGVYFDMTQFERQRPAAWRLDTSTSCAVLRDAREQLAAYFEGNLTAFDLPLAPRGTPFQQSVWAALRAIPFGTTVSYGDIARQIDGPSAVRAVGAANGKNPIPIIVPCHRVVGADGSLTGFGGGMDRKRWLLAHEARYSEALIGG